MTKTEALRQARACVGRLCRFGPQWVYHTNEDGKGWRQSIPRDYARARAGRAEVIQEIVDDLMRAQ